MLLTSQAPHIPSLQKMHYLPHHPYQETRVSCLVANFPYSLLYQPIKVSPLPPPYKKQQHCLGKARVEFFQDHSFLFQQPLPPLGKGGPRYSTSCIARTSLVPNFPLVVCRFSTLCSASPLAILFSRIGCYAVDMPRFGAKTTGT